VDLLRRAGACGPALSWAATLPPETTPEGAWQSCPDGRWLVWSVGRLHVRGLVPRQVLVRAAVAPARCALERVADAERRAEIERHLDVVARWTRDEATSSEVREARQLLWQVAAAAAAAHHAAYAYAAYAAAYAAAAADADADADAAYAAAAAAAAIRAAVPWSTIGDAVQALAAQGGAA
jgi:hypothetical protein